MEQGGRCTDALQYSMILERDAQLHMLSVLSLPGCIIVGICHADTLAAVPTRLVRLAVCACKQARAPLQRC
jgi:hypothetical protein